MTGDQSKNPEHLDTKPRQFLFVPQTWADLVNANDSFIGIEETGELYIYQNGIYVPGEFAAKYKAQNILGKHSRAQRLNEIVTYLIYNQPRSLNEFDQKTHILNLQNGLLDINTLDLCNHDPLHECFVQLPVKYDPLAECPNFERFLLEVLHPDDIPAMQEFFGYTLLCEVPIHKAVMLIGGGRNGKTTLLEVLQAMIGENNYSNISLHQLLYDKFTVSRLVGKLANIYDDLPKNPLGDVGVFKVLTSGSRIDAQKKHKDSFSFRPYAKLIFSCNKMPKSDDVSDAYFSRWILFNFPNQFMGDSADKNLKAKLTTPEELSGVLNWAIEGLFRLLNNGEFSTQKSLEDIKMEMVRQADTMAAFVQDCVTECEDGIIEKNTLYSAYVQYCQAHKLQPDSNIAFWRDGFPMNMPFAKVTQNGRGKSSRVVKGLELNISDKMENHQQDDLDILLKSTTYPVDLAVSQCSIQQDDPVESTRSKSHPVDSQTLENTGDSGTNQQHQQDNSNIMRMRENEDYDSNILSEKHPVEPVDKLISVEFLENLPEIVGIDGKTYGPFEKGEILTLSLANGRALIDGGGARFAGDDFDYLPQKERARGILKAIGTISGKNGDYASLEELGKELPPEYQQFLKQDLQKLMANGEIWERKPGQWTVIS